jgi:hypothetical protein
MEELKFLWHLLKNNYQWLFDGLGVFFLSLLFIRQRRADQQQRIQKHAVGIQGGRDVEVGHLTINNTTGISVADVKDECLLLFNENFPRLREEAIAAARSNVDKLIPLMEKNIRSNIERIDLGRLADPDILASLNDAVQATARKGAALDLDLLSELVVTRLRTDSSDFLSVVAEEAIRVLPRLTSSQLAFLALSIGLSVRRTDPPITSTSELEENGKVLLPFVQKGFKLSKSEKLHMISLGVAINQIYAYEGKWATLASKFAFLSAVHNPEQIVRAEAPTYSLILDQYKDVERLELTAVGRFLGCILIARAFSIWDPLTIFAIISNNDA